MAGMSGGAIPVLMMFANRTPHIQGVFNPLDAARLVLNSNDQHPSCGIGEGHNRSQDIDRRGEIALEFQGLPFVTL